MQRGAAISSLRYALTWTNTRCERDGVKSCTRAPVMEAVAAQFIKKKCDVVMRDIVGIVLERDDR